MLVNLYTDGACKGNPGPGGWACILSSQIPGRGLYEKSYCGGVRMTTNNRMELAAVINGLLHVNGSNDIVVVSDSFYVCNAFNKNWVQGWKASNWKNGKLPNSDMWNSLYNLVTMQNSVRFQWVAGHNGHKYNEECDKLAVQCATNSACWEVDQGYESGKFRGEKKK